jgi:hypothetical protein
MRVDWPHLRSIESAVSFDFDMLCRGMMTGINQPYLINGFDIQIPNAAINASELTVTVAGATLLHSSATQSGTILNVPTTQADEVLSPSNPNVIGSFQAGTLNYVGLDYTRMTDPSTEDQTAGWSPSQQLEFQRTVPIGNILQYQFHISTSGFATYLPLWIVSTTNTGAVQFITKCTPDFWRLGTGGADPNPYNSFQWGGYNNTQAGANGRREWISTVPGQNPLTVQPGDDPNAFFYGDFSIKTLKQKLDAMDTRFKEITNSQYWYMDSNIGGSGPSGNGPTPGTSVGLNLYDLYLDSIGSVMTGAGTISFNLVLQAGPVTYGAFQSSATDPTALAGDEYVVGQTSGVAADLTAFNGGTLLINSITSNNGFIFNEPLTERRLYRPNPSQWILQTFVDDTSTWAALQRVSALSPTPNNIISSWSFATNDDGTAASQAVWSIVTINTSSAHGLNPGQWVNISGLLSSGNPPNGVFRIASTPSTTSLTYATIHPCSGTFTVAGTNNCSLDSSTRQPYNPYLPITAFAAGVGSTGVLTIPNNSFLAPVSLTGNFTISSDQITAVSSTSQIFLGSRIVSSNFAAGFAHVLGISGSTLTMSATSTANATGAVIDVQQEILVQGLQATGFTSQQLDGVHVVQAVAGNQITINTPGTIVSPSVAVGANADLFYYQFTLSVTGALPDAYNVDNIEAFGIANDQVQFVVGPSTLPSVPIASGAFQFDGVVAQSTVLNPVRVSTITNDGAGNLTVTTFTPHNLITGGPQSFTIYGNSALSQYIRSYTNVGIVSTGTYTFQITGTGIISVASYTNVGGLDNTFIYFANNPYAGPVQWSADIVVKAIIGDLSFTIPQTATVQTADPNVDPAANQFNVNGQTGTAYVQDGEVLYVILERNEPVSGTTIFSTAGGSSIIPTSSIMTDVEGNALVPGDFIKFAGEADNYWLKIATINATTVTLVTDRGQSPTIIQRPAASGPMLYCKGVYPKVYVKLHDLVDTTADVYWLAVRRDNGGLPKVYFRDLELSPGEVRNVNDGVDNNLLIYTGANTEGAVNPNYSISQPSGPFQFTQGLTIQAVDNLTQMVTFTTDAGNIMQSGDQISYYDGTLTHYFTIAYIITSRTVILQQATTILAASQNVIYYREDQFIEDTDNLTLALRKEDRQAGQISTALTTPVYDESVFVQQINFSGSGLVRSGSYIYQGTQYNPTALAWVLHGTANVSETIEGVSITMPGGNPNGPGPNAVLAHIVFGTWSNGSGVFQNGASTGRTVNNPGNPPFTAPSIYGDAVGGGIEMVLPPNRRTQISGGGGFVVFGNHSFYKQDANTSLSGEELLIIMNDGIREGNIDYTETFGGPKAKVQLIRYAPPNTRIRFRNLSAYGSAVISKSSDVTLQSAYNAGNSIVIAPGTPVSITSDNVPAGSAALVVNGSIYINGGSAKLGGIYNITAVDQGFQIGNETNKPQGIWSGYHSVKTHTDHPGSAVQKFTTAQVVTGSAGTIITSSITSPGSQVTLNANTAYRIKIDATAYRSDGPLGVASFSLGGTFYLSGGVATPAGQPWSMVNGFDGDGANYAIVFAVSGNQVMAVVYGTTGATVQWVLAIETQAVSTP